MIDSLRKGTTLRPPVKLDYRSTHPYTKPELCLRGHRLVVLQRDSMRDIRVPGRLGKQGCLPENTNNLRITASQSMTQWWNIRASHTPSAIEREETDSNENLLNRRLSSSSIVVDWAVMIV